VIGGHLGVIVGAALLTSAVSIVVSAAFFSPQFWPEYVGAIVLIALTYAMIGVLLGPLVGRLGGLYLLLLLSIVDAGYGQSVMFHPLPPTWGAYLPTRGAGRLLVDGSFTSGFEQYGSLLLALAWLGVLGVGAMLTFRHQIGVRPIARLSARAMQAEPAAVPRSVVTSVLSGTRSALPPQAPTDACHSPEGQGVFIPRSHLASNLKTEHAEQGGAS
jgi:hypothetical protein